MNLFIERHNNTFALIINEIIYATTKEYWEIDELIQEYIDENELDHDQVTVWENI